MEIQTRLPFTKKISLGAKATLLSSIIRASTHLPDNLLVHAVRRLTGARPGDLGRLVKWAPGGPETIASTLHACSQPSQCWLRRPASG